MAPCRHPTEGRSLHPPSRSSFLNYRLLCDNGTNSIETYITYCLDSLTNTFANMPCSLCWSRYMIDVTFPMHLRELYWSLLASPVLRAVGSEGSEMSVLRHDLGRVSMFRPSIRVWYCSTSSWEVLVTSYRDANKKNPPQNEAPPSIVRPRFLLVKQQGPCRLRRTSLTICGGPHDRIMIVSTLLRVDAANDRSKCGQATASDKTRNSQPKPHINPGIVI